MSLLNAPFVPFPSPLSSSSASPSRSTTTVQTCTRSRLLPSSAPARHWRESGRLTDSAPHTDSVVVVVRECTCICHDRLSHPPFLSPRKKQSSSESSHAVILVYLHSLVAEPGDVSHGTAKQESLMDVVGRDQARTAGRQAGNSVGMDTDADMNLDSETDQPGVLNQELKDCVDEPRRVSRQVLRRESLRESLRAWLRVQVCLRESRVGSSMDSSVYSSVSTRKTRMLRQSSWESAESRQP